jgi:hypothetical protein
MCIVIKSLTTFAKNFTVGVISMVQIGNVIKNMKFQRDHINQFQTKRKASNLVLIFHTILNDSLKLMHCTYILKISSI